MAMAAFGKNYQSPLSLDQQQFMYKCTLATLNLLYCYFAQLSVASFLFISIQLNRKLYELVIS